MTHNPKLGIIEPIMGISKKRRDPRAELGTDTRMSMADALFTNTQQRVLAVLFGQPSRSFYANELIALARGGSGAVQRELARLVRSELVTVRTSGNQKHYQANPASPIFAELCALTQKTMGLVEPLRAALAPLADSIRAAFIFGSVAKREDTASSDVDLMLVSDELAYPDVFVVLGELSRSLGRSVNPTIYTSQDLATRLKRGDAFLQRVFAQPKIWVTGSDDVLGA